MGELRRLEKIGLVWDGSAISLLKSPGIVAQRNDRSEQGYKVV